jgi:transposase-like protein
MKIRLTLPTVKSVPEDRPSSCPSCGHWRLHRHGTVPKPLTDHRQSQVLAQRYKCVGCQRTFRHYPAGVTRQTQSQHTVALAALLYGLGLSCSAAAHVLTALDMPLSRMSVWRDAQVVGACLRTTGPVGRVRVLGVDETSIKVRGQETIVGIVTDAQRELTLGWTILPGVDAATIQAWLAPLVEQWGVEVLLTDEAPSYGVAAAELGLDHQLCLTHVRKAVTRRCRSIYEQAKGVWRTDPEQLALVRHQLRWLRRLVQDLPAGGGVKIEQVHRTYQQARSPRKAEQASVAYRMRLLTLDLWDHWDQFRLARRRPDLNLDGTNNVTERAISKTKVRYKTMRGYKSRSGVDTGIALTQWLYSGASQHDLGAILNG